MSSKKKILFFVVLAALIVFSSCSEKKNDKVTIAVAANMQYAMEALVKQFEAKTGISCHLITGSSGKLTAQITEGAPYDVFIAADMKYPGELYNSGLALAPPVSCGYGQLVLWTTIEELSPSIPLLKERNINHIALANPQSAPYGRAAMQVLNHYKLYDSLSHKLVYGESISQTNQFITSKSAEMGFTAMAVVLSQGLRSNGNWSVIDSKTYSPIQQGVVIVKRDQVNSDDIRAFYEYLFSREAKMLLKNFGYLVDE